MHTNRPTSSMHTNRIQTVTSTRLQIKHTYFTSLLHAHTSTCAHYYSTQCFQSDIEAANHVYLCVVRFNHAPTMISKSNHAPTMTSNAKKDKPIMIANADIRKIPIELIIPIRKPHRRNWTIIRKPHRRNQRSHCQSYRFRSQSLNLDNSNP
eukprot:26484_1